MPKSKNYKTPNTPNTEYKNQISPTSEYKNKNIKSNKLATTGKLINSSSNSDNSQNSQTFIVIAKSTCHNLLMYMDEKVEAFIKREEPLEIAHESIAKAAKLLIQNDTPLSKHQAYRNMKEISSEYDYILKCSSNSEIPKPHGIKLQDNVDAYFYAMLYPPIFEVCNNTSKDLMYSKYAMCLELWHNMLTQAIIIDSFFDGLHESILKLLNDRNDTILYDPSPESKYTYSPKSYNKSSTNYKDKLLELYRPSIEFACHVKEKTLDDRKSTTTQDKSIKSMINFPFLQSGNRGTKMNNYIYDCIEFFNTFQDWLPKEHKNYKSAKFLKLYQLYNFQKQLHLFDFIWHSEFNKVNFHLTNGFVTNYVLYFILKQNKDLISIIFNDENNKHKDEHICPIKSGKDETYEFGIAYTSPNSTELSFENTLENYDLEFINSLIKRASITLSEYTLNFKDRQANRLWDFISNCTVFTVADNFFNYVNSLFNDSFVQEFRNIWNDSTDYYKQIYEDTHF